MNDERYRRVAYDLIHAGSTDDLLRLRVISDSMSPLLRSGDTVMAQPLDPAALHGGDVIVVRRGDELITHRLVAVDAQGWHTRGDNAASVDAIAAAHDIVGWVIAVDRAGRVIDLRRRRWRIANRMLGCLGRWHVWLFQRGRRVTFASAGSRGWKAIGAALLALPFRWLMRLIVFVAVKL